jgi:hypothetical protein
MHTQVIQNGGTLRLADLAGFEAIELHPTTDGRRVHVMAYTAEEWLIEQTGGAFVIPDGEAAEPAEPTAEDYRRGFDLREQWERERRGLTPCGADRGELQAAADDLTAASDRARAALAAVVEARAKLERLAGDAGATSNPRITAGGKVVSGEED